MFYRQIRKQGSIVCLPILYTVDDRNLCKLDLNTMCIYSRVETKMPFSIFAKMQKSCENGPIFAIMWGNARFYIFVKIFAIFVHFRKKIFAKSEKKFSQKFRENAKTKIFVSTLINSLLFTWSLVVGHTRLGTIYLVSKLVGTFLLKGIVSRETCIN
jgi:hypothetical protein